MQALSGTLFNLTSLNHFNPFKIAQLNLSFPITLTAPVSPNSNLMLISQPLSHDAKLPSSVSFKNSISHQSTIPLSCQLTEFQTTLVMRKQFILHVFRQQGTGMNCPFTLCATPTSSISRLPFSMSSTEEPSSCNSLCLGHLRYNK